MSRAILVTGATGKQGGSLINALLASPQASKYTILAVTRNAASASSQALATRSSSIKLVQANLNDAAALLAKAKEVNSGPIWGVFSIQAPASPGAKPEGEEKQGKDLVDASVAAGVEMFVYTSVDRGGEEKSWTTPTPIGHFISKHNIELHLKAKAGDTMKWTILRPTAFMDNWNPGFFGGVMASTWRITVKEKPLQIIAVKDIGIFAAKAFDSPEQYNHKAISLAGDEITFEQAAKTYKEKLGKEMPTSYGFVVYGLLAMVKEVKTMFEWFYTDGYKADIHALKQTHPGLLNWSEWLETDSKHEMKK